MNNRNNYILFSINKRRWLFLPLVFILLVGSACTDNLGITDVNSVREGIPVQVTVSFGVGELTVVTRSAESEETENKVNDVFLFAFNADGSLDNSAYFTNFTVQDGCLTVDFSMHSGTNKQLYAIGNPESGSGTLTTDVLSTVENIGDLQKLTSRLRIPYNVERNAFLMSGQLESAASGITVAENGTISGYVQSSEHTHNSPLIELERVDARITFRVTATPPEDKKDVYGNFTFTPDYYQVENIPQGTYVFPNENDYQAQEEGEKTYDSMSGHNIVMPFDSEEGNYQIFEFYLPENRLDYKKKITKEEQGDASSLYALREKQNKEKLEESNPNKPQQTERNTDFVYANDYSTYVVIHGILSYTDKSSGITQFVQADATYTIHLGNTGRDADDEELVNNYDTERNTHYTYTVTVTGVNSMVVEVDKEKEVRPGVEGDVIIAGNEVVALDSHYGRTHFTLSRANIRRGLSWSVSTPFQEGMRVFDQNKFLRNDNGLIQTTKSAYSETQWKALQTDLDLNDYKWVQFIVNEEAIEHYDAHTHFVKYPGYRCYDGGSGNDNPAPPFGGKGAVPPSTNQNYPSENKFIVAYDINQLINHLYAEANNPQSDIFVNPENNNVDKSVESTTSVVHITAFVDEYVYIYNPKNEYYKAPVTLDENSDADAADLLLWKEVVNRENRMLNICTEQNVYSPDGNTSLARSVFTIAQRPVHTFYNINDNKVTEGWGTESIMETGRLQASLLDGTSLSYTWDYNKTTQIDKFFSEKGNRLPGERTNNTSNGRRNTLNILSGDNSSSGDSWDNIELKWSDVMNLDYNGYGVLKEDYNNVWYACVARNRDLDGDDYVDENEIRWYLASIDQLTDIWVGEWSLNKEAWLYQVDEGEVEGGVSHHIASSSYWSETGEPWVLWAEEGASRGRWGESATASDYGNGFGASNRNQKFYDYRCVRNLGLSLSDVDKEPQTYRDGSLTSEGNFREFTNRLGETYSEKWIDLSALDIASVRTAEVVSPAVQPIHNERSRTNRPYRIMAMLVDEESEDGQIYPLKGHINWNNGQNETNGSICPDGYRMPNQRELMLLYMTYPKYLPFEADSREHFYSKTTYGYNTSRPGFSYYSPVTGNSGNLMLLQSDERNSSQGKVRCVRDVAE